MSEDGDEGPAPGDWGGCELEPARVGVWADNSGSARATGPDGDGEGGASFEYMPVVEAEDDGGSGYEGRTGEGCAEIEAARLGPMDALCGGVCIWGGMRDDVAGADGGGTGGLEKSSKGGIMVGRGTPFVVGGAGLSALFTSVRKASSSRKS